MTASPAEIDRKPPLKVLLCSPRGFCAGVVRAIDTVERALARYGAPVYVRHEIVHNRYVVESLKAKGAVFVEELDEVPDTAAPVIFSAHGVPKSIPAEAQRRNFFALDATCPLVTKVHREAEIHHKRGREIVLIGHADHPEVVGTVGQLPVGAITLVQSVDEVARFEPRDPTGPFSIFTALPLLIYRWTTLPQAEFQYAAAAAIVVLLALLLVMNSLAILLRNRFSRRLT